MPSWGNPHCRFTRVCACVNRKKKKEKEQKERKKREKKKKQGEKEVLQFYIYKLPIDRPAAVNGNITIIHLFLVKYTQ